MKYKVDLIKNNIRDILELDNYKGYNPYDLLKSEYLEGVNDSKTLYYLSQLLKISPINFRPSFFTLSAKSIDLFASITPNPNSLLKVNPA